MSHWSKEAYLKLHRNKAHQELPLMIQFEASAWRKFNRKYHKDSLKQYNNKVLDELIFNRKTRLVALFKEYMIADYIDEFMKREYKMGESKERIPKFSQYYQNYAIFFGMPTFSDFSANDIIKDFGERKAEVYYNKNYKMIYSDECAISGSNYSSNVNDDRSSSAMVDKTIFDSKMKDNIDNATMFTNKDTDSNLLSCNNTIQRIINSTNRSKAMNESSIVMNQNEIVLSTLNNKFASNETSLISYIKLFTRHQSNKAKQIDRRIQVKKLCPYPPSTILTKRKNTHKDSDGGNGSETSNNIISNQSISKLKGLLSSSTNYFNSTKKYQLGKMPMNSHKSNISNNSNASNHCKKSSSVQKTRSRNVKHSDIGFKTDENRKYNQPTFQMTKTQKIDNIIRKYTINYSSKKLISSLKKKGTSASQLKLNLKNHHPLVVSQLKKESLIKLNANSSKGKQLHPHLKANSKSKDKDSSKPRIKSQSKQSADDIMKMTLTLLMENKSKPSTTPAPATSNSNAHVNININNQININTNYPLQDSITNKLLKNDSVAMNINSNLSNLLKATKHSRNKSTNGLSPSSDEDRSMPSTVKGLIVSSYCQREKKMRKSSKKSDTPNTFNRLTSKDLKQKMQHPQFPQPQIKSYLCKDTIARPRQKITYSSSNRLFQTMNQPLMVNTYAKSINSIKNHKAV